jgi:hypothetical protein
MKSGPTAPLPKDPQPSVDRIDELAKRVLTGDILLPKFQRDLVWERPQVIELLDSIVKNYPIGSLLLWQSRQELSSDNRIADLEIKLPKPDYPVNYLLDGQQRLSTICGALYWNGNDPKSVWNIAYDLKQQKFLHLDTLDEPPLHQVRMNKLSDGSTFYKYCAALDSINSPDKDTLRQNADNLFNRFKDYKVAVVTLGDMSIKDVAPIFERINSTGTRLTIVDLMRAATWSQDFDLIDTIDEIRDLLKQKNFGGLDRKVILRVMSSAAGGGFSAESIDDLRKHSSDFLKTIADDTSSAFERTVDFLSSQIVIPNDSIIPYTNQVVVLTEIFRLCLRPNADQYREIMKWFWRSSISGYFSGWNTGMMTRDKEAVQKFLSGKSSEIEIHASKPSKSIWKDKVFRTDGAHAKTLAILLSYNKPKDLLTGQSIESAMSLSWTNSKEYHHFFPKDYLKSNNVPNNKANCLANIIMLTSSSNKHISNKAPSDYLKEVISSSGASLGDWLKSNLISEKAFKAALNDDYEAFLNERAETINERVADLAQWKIEE